MLKVLAAVAFGAVLVSTPAARLPQAAAGAETTSQPPRIEPAPGSADAAPERAGAAPEAQPNAAIDARKFEAIEPLVKAAIAEKKLPGAVVLVGRGDRILYQKAIGQRA